MRLGFLCASAALAGGLLLSACSSSTGSSSGLPSSGGQGLAMGRSHGHTYKIHLMPGVKPMTIGCDYSVYAFCFYVVPNDPGPYIETGTSPSYELYNNAYIQKVGQAKNNKKFSTYFYPDPGNPTYQYITYTGNTPKKAKSVKFVDYYCIGFSPSDCTGTTYTFKLGIAISPPS